MRHHHFGEGEYAESEKVIQDLLRENGARAVDGSMVNVSGAGAEAAPNWEELQSPETYVGYRQAERFASPERVSHGAPQMYSVPARLSLNEWGLSGLWNVGGESALLLSPPGKIVFRFHSRDLHLIMRSSGIPVRFMVKLDGGSPRNNHGTDIDADGRGEVREPRLYQLIRQREQVKDRTFEIEFPDPGAQAVVFTFG